MENEEKRSMDLAQERKMLAVQIRLCLETPNHNEAEIIQRIDTMLDQMVIDGIVLASISIECEAVCSNSDDVAD